MVEEFFTDNEPSRLKRAVIAGAAEALKYKNKNIKKSDDEVIKHITSNVDKIIDNID
ncbi:MAG: hypothetical protein QXX91_03340 [Thermoplasmata archaeon]